MEHWEAVGIEISEAVIDDFFLIQGGRSGHSLSSRNTAGRKLTRSMQSGRLLGPPNEYVQVFR